MESVNNKEKKRERSALYPSCPLQECIEFVKTIDNLGGKSVSIDLILNSLGLSSRATKSFARKVSSSRQFNLITLLDDYVQLSDAAKMILYPTSESDSTKVLKDCMYSPPLYKKLIDRFDKRTLPNKTILGNILMNDYSIIKSAKDDAVDAFVESAQFTGILNNGYLDFNAVKENTDHYSSLTQADNQTSDEAMNSRQLQEVYAQSITKSSIDRQNSIPVDNFPDNRALEKEQENNRAEEASYYKFEIPILDSNVSKVLIPKEATIADLYLIKNMLNALLDTLIQQNNSK